MTRAGRSQPASSRDAARSPCRPPAGEPWPARCRCLGQIVEAHDQQIARDGQLDFACTLEDSERQRVGCDQDGGRGRGGWPSRSPEADLPAVRHGDRGRRAREPCGRSHRRRRVERGAGGRPPRRLPCGCGARSGGRPRRFTWSETEFTGGDLEESALASRLTRLLATRRPTRERAVRAPLIRSNGLHRRLRRRPRRCRGRSCLALSRHRPLQQ
jgi:hypothetical protein